ncbi:MAG: helix-turn-helix domain-containing protein [Gammaproteobacteria bacterium]
MQTKPLKRVALKRLKTKEEILTAALENLLDQGMEGLTLAAVAEKLGFTKPALYHYFRSKEDLLRSLILELLHQETIALIDAVSKSAGRGTVLGTLIRAFYQHYRGRLNAFRLIYCQFQLMDVRTLGFDADLIRNDVNPLTHRLFDIVVSILSDNGKHLATPAMRQLAFAAWLAAVGLLEMIGIADAGKDPLRHSDDALLSTLEKVFNAAADTPAALA